MKQQGKLILLHTGLLLFAFVLFFGAKWAVGRFAPAVVQQEVADFKEETFGEDSLYYAAKSILFKKGTGKFTLKYLDAVADSNLKLDKDITELNIFVILKALPPDCEVTQVEIEGDVTDIYIAYNPQLLNAFYDNLNNSKHFLTVEKYDGLSLIKLVSAP